MEFSPFEDYYSCIFITEIHRCTVCRVAKTKWKTFHTLSFCLFFHNNEFVIFALALTTDSMLNLPDYDMWP